MNNYFLYRYATLLAKRAEPCPLSETDEIVLAVLYLGQKTFHEICDFLPMYERSGLLKACRRLLENGLVEREKYKGTGWISFRYRISKSGLRFEEYMNERSQHYIDLFKSQFKSV